MDDRQSVTSVLQAFVRQSIESLQAKHFEHDDAAAGFASSSAFTLLLVHTLQDRPKYLPVNHGLESLQWITRLAQAGAAVLKVKEIVLYMLVYSSPAI